MGCISMRPDSRWVARLVACTRRTLVAFLLSLFALNCSTSATIYLKEGGYLVGTIERSDSRHIYIVQEDSPGEIAVLRSHIEQIQHPGAAAGAMGTLFTLGGIGLVIAGAVTDCPPPEPDPPCEDWLCLDFSLEIDVCGANAMLGFGVALLIFGGPSMIWGWSEFAASKSRARPPEDSGLSVIPIMLSDGERLYYGGALGLSW